MHIVRTLICALAALALASPGSAADKKRPATRPAPAAERKEVERPPTATEAQRLQALGYELLRPFRDCADCPEMIVIPSGSFDMGLPANEAGRAGDQPPPRRVTIGKAFALGRTEVTRRQWRAITGANPTGSSACDDCPVQALTWTAAQDFIGRLNIKTGKQYRLPSEAEWEYACRAGGRHKSCGSDDADSVAWHEKNSGGGAHVVASKAANAFGLHDMSGNAWEWTADCWHLGETGAPADGSAWVAAGCASHVLRGGSWQYQNQYAGAAVRAGGADDVIGDGDGFRVAQTLP